MMPDGGIVTDSNFNSSPTLIPAWSNDSISQPKFVNYLRRSINKSTASLDNYCNHVKNKYEINSVNLKNALQNRRSERMIKRQNFLNTIAEAKQTYIPCANSYEEKFQIVC
tara:strand:- start:99 stop:431 length:333 start_codon:yes stop_codon:yes gene_type:complete